MSLLIMILSIVTQSYAMDGWDTFKKEDQYNNSQLHFYVSKNDAKNVELLIKKGVDVNAINIQGETALHWAAFLGNIEVIKCLVEAGAHINPQESRNLNPLQYAFLPGAIHEKTMSVMNLLIAHGADVNSSILPSEWTPLFYAVDKNDMACVKTLLEKGANI